MASDQNVNPNKPEPKTVELEIPVGGGEREDSCRHPHRVDPLELREQALIDAAIKDHLNATVYINDARYAYQRIVSELWAKMNSPGEPSK